jgi:hypothetical protein
MEQFFAPPVQPSMPQSSGENGQNLGAPNQSNYAPRQESRETKNEFARSVARSGKIKQATSAIIRTRSQFKQYLLQNGMDLYTSAVEFQQSGDFIMSSYIVYLQHNNLKEPLFQFLQRYPNLQQPVINIRDQLSSAQQNMQVLTPKLSQQNPFANFNQF